MSTTCPDTHENPSPFDANTLLRAVPAEMPDEAVRGFLCDIHRLRAMADALALEATGVLDRRTIWAGDAARSAGAWLAARVDLTPFQARHEADIARSLRTMPHVEAASRSGRLGRVKVDALIGVCTPELVEVFAAQEQYLVQQIEPLRADEARRFLKAWQQFARQAIGSVDPDDPDPPDKEPVIAVNLVSTFQGRWVLDGEMDAEHGAILDNLITAEVDAMFHHGVFKADDGLTPTERRGQALAQIFLRNGEPGTKNGEIRPSVEVIVDERTLTGIPIQDDDDQHSRVCETRKGHPIPPRTLARLVCNAVLHRLVMNAEGEPLDLGFDVRLATRAQKRALAFRHRGCAFPGCTAPAEWCEAHHIEPFNPTRGTGPTNLDGLILLCRFHHHRVHEGGFKLTRTPDRTIQVRRPDGTLNRPGFVGGSRSWKRGWSYAEGDQAGEADDASVFRGGEGSGGAVGSPAAS